MAAYDGFTLKVDPADLQRAADDVEKKVNSNVPIINDGIETSAVVKIIII